MRSTLTSLFAIDFRKSLGECCSNFYRNQPTRDFYYMIMVNNTVGFCDRSGALLKAVSFDKQYYSLNCQKASLKLFDQEYTLQQIPYTDIPANVLVTDKYLRNIVYSAERAGTSNAYQWNVDSLKIIINSLQNTFDFPQTEIVSKIIDILGPDGTVFQSTAPDSSDDNLY